MNLNLERIENELNLIQDQVVFTGERVSEQGKRLDAIEKNHREQSEITQKCQKKDRKFLARIYRRQKDLIEKTETATTKDELKQDIELLTTSIKNLECTAERIISRGATKSDIATAIGNLQVTQQITQQAVVPQVGSTWYYF